MSNILRTEDGRWRWGRIVLVSILAASGAQDLFQRDWLRGFQYLLLTAGLLASMENSNGRQAASSRSLRRFAGVAAVTVALVLFAYRVTRDVFRW